MQSLGKEVFQSLKPTTERADEHCAKFLLLLLFVEAESEVTGVSHIYVCTLCL